ncbi:MAG: hypothetical protein HeimC2_22630 [Candidatus Heimdallarchaeota archaeon LC_2]|nr:MAG: hypothetical protein HeimC2_22630 [Candidatus Heimdallarchaeota archaeon LC_2]
MYCSSCGMQNEDGSMFCSNCGNTLDSSSGQPAKQLSNYNESSYSAQPPHQPSYVENQSNQDYIFQNQQQQQQYNQPQLSGSYQGQDSYRQSHYGPPMIQDKINPLLYVLIVFFFPIGILLFFANRRTKPQSAKNIAIATVIGIILAIGGL